MVVQLSLMCLGSEQTSGGRPLAAFMIVSRAEVAPLRAGRAATRGMLQFLLTAVEDQMWPLLCAALPACKMCCVAEPAAKLVLSDECIQ